MRIDEFDYDLPEELIAQRPAETRDASRMLVVDRAKQNFTDHVFSDLPNFLRAGDLVVLNNTKVFPARLYGQTETGAGVEVFLVTELADGNWEVLAKPGRRLKVGKRIDLSDRLSATVIEKLEEGKVILHFDADGQFNELVDELGRTPLPPYIKREKTDIDADRERYQTVYAKTRGAIAAPTAGLHFTPEILEKLKTNNIEVAEITLHVGYGTFEPVRVDDLAEHKVLAETYEIDENTASTLNAAKTTGHRIVAIGTTTTRALESNVSKFENFAAGRHVADLTITPGYSFCAIDALLTNFHLPKSSLLVLTSVFAGHELIMNAYRHSVAERYRFYSYGDCMFIV